MASRSVNKVILLGHLGKDADTRFSPSGVARTTFTLATNRRVKDNQTGEWKDETDWHNVVAFRMENLSNYLTKGKQVYVEGRMQTRTYEKEGQKHYMTEVVADDVILLSGRGGEGAGGDEYTQQRPVSAPRTQRPAGAAPAAPDFGSEGITDDDVPF